MKGTYTRWTRHKDATLRADWVGSDYHVVADPTSGKVFLYHRGHAIEADADTARMLAVRLIEGAALADTAAIRETE